MRTLYDLTAAASDTVCGGCVSRTGTRITFRRTFDSPDLSHRRGFIQLSIISALRGEMEIKMKFRRSFFAFLAALLLCSCMRGTDAPDADTGAASSQDSAVSEATFQTEAEAEKVTVSPLAEEDFLLPLEDFSWEREYDAQFVMIHFTSAVMVSRDDPYSMDSVRQIFEAGGISINYIIDREGVIRCYIPEDRAAWHAGKGTYGGEEKYTDAMNRYSVGIELVGIGSASDMAQYLTAQEYASLDPSLIGFTEAQYESLAALVEDICERNSIPLDREHVIGHNEYNPAKADPGELFDWSRIVK